MTKKEFLRALEEAIGADPNSIGEEDLLKEIAEWDSMGTVGFIAMADERLGMLVPPASLGSCLTVRDLIALFGEKITSIDTCP